ncbi:MAG: DUF4911 domain-containing protein [Thermodesulfobacteriota bacterium]
MQSTVLSLTIDRGKIAWLRFVLESYEGLALLRTLDPQAGRVVLLIGRGAEAETAGLLDALEEEIGLVKGLSDDWSQWRENRQGRQGPLAD